MESLISLQDVVSKPLQVFKVDKPLRPLEHANTHFFLSPDATNSNGRFKAFEYQKFLINAFADLNILKVAVQKPAQVGFTQLLKWLCGYSCSHVHRSVGIYFPTATDANEFSSTQISSLLRDCPDVAKELTVDYEKKHTDNQASRRKFKQATLFIRGATSANNFRRISFSTGLLDELDGMPSNIEGEGSADALIWSRMYAANYKKLIMGSTPTITGESNIESILSTIREKFRRYYPCPHCNHYQTLVWGGADSKHGLHWDKIYFNDNSIDYQSTSETARYVCEECEQSFNYSNLRTIDKKAYWKSDNFIADDETGKITPLLENGLSNPKEIGIYLTGLQSYTVSWSEAVLQYLKAVDNAREGDNGQLITFVNEYLGETYTPSEVREQTPYTVLYNRREDFGDFIPDKIKAVVIGADVQKDRIEFTEIGFATGEESYVLNHTVRMGDPANDQDLWDYLFDLAHTKVYTKSTGETLGVALFCIDSGYLTDTVFKFCKRSTTKLIPVKSTPVFGRPVADMPANKTKHGVYNTLCGSDTAKDILYSRWKLDLPQAGYVHFSMQLPEEYFKQIVSEYKKADFKSGKPVERWFCPKSRRNEGLDCFVYALCGIRILQTRYGIDLDVTKQKILSRYNPASLAKMWKQRLA